MAAADPSSAAAQGSRQQPPWSIPKQTDPSPQLVVYNSLTRTKTPFVPMRGNHITWYNCGPTVYDASHMGHARNYVSQDIMRRILNHLGYSIHFVMNITDIDDKIIVRARQNHLLDEFRKANPTLTQGLVKEVRDSWSAYLRKKKMEQFAPPPPAGGDGHEDAIWEEISRLNSDAAWRAETLKQEPMFGLWYNALNESRQAIIAATMAVTAINGSSPPTSSDDLLAASKEILSSSLDDTLKHTVSDHSIFRALAATWETAYFDDMKRLNVLPPSQLTRVSEYVPEIVTFTEKIIRNGFAYDDGAGNVYFDTKAFDGADLSDGEKASYAKLAPWSKGNKELLQEGEGSLTGTHGKKRYASDFALWKASKEGEPSWPSPWGPGRPGWHIECSVMASEVLGSQIDVHSGGVDLMFPHHDNELAQSEAYHGCSPWINYFLHTGHLHIEGLKMSKSLKNFISIDEALEKFSARQLRLAFLFQSWSSKMDFSEAAMQEVGRCEKQFDKFFVTVKTQLRSYIAKGPSYSDGLHHYGREEKELIAALTSAQVEFRKALCDSFDTPSALRILQNLVSAANVYEKNHRQDLNARVLETVARWVGAMLRMFGLGTDGLRESEIGWGEAGEEGVTGSAALSVDHNALILPYLEALSKFRSSVRQLARSGAPASELLKLADRLRDEDLVELGVALEDVEGEGAAMVKLVPAEQLRSEREERLRLAEEKARRKEDASRRAAEARVERLRRGRVPPALLFRPTDQGGLAAEGDFARWDDNGLPTLDGKTGEELSKSRKKALAKELLLHAKLHEEYLAAKERGEVE